jgi:serine protease inhibitor
MAGNVFGLAEVGEIEVQMFNLAQMLIRIPKFKFSTNAPLLQNPC